MAYTKDQLLSRLQELKIEFNCYDHPAVLTVEAQAQYVGHLGGALSKNLFLKDKKHKLYVVSALADTKVDLKNLSQRLGLGKGGLRMAPEEALQEILHVPIGCVTPFALINESASVVSLILDKGFKSQQTCYFHPLTNEVTIALNSSNLDKFLVSIGREPAYVDLEDCRVVGKDNPPDLAHLVPAEKVEISTTTITVPVQSSIPKENKIPQSKGKASEVSTVQKTNKEKTPENKNNSTPLITDVNNFVDNILEKISKAFVSEISKKSSGDQSEISDSVLEGVKERVTSDLVSMSNMLKNTAYTEGYHAGIATSFSSLQKLVSKK